ncbi:MAG TPA: flagellar hook-associated protein 3 [Desulfovibrio sp.]|nr:flagellar hook-associated protein 3 [Desulfovibrio sp.]
MRVSTSQIFSASLSQINSALYDVTRLNLMTSSQKKINTPSDDPSGMAAVINLRDYSSALSRYTDNCSTAGNYLSEADSVLSQASEVVTSIMELAEQGSTETYTTEELRMMAEEMEGYLESLMALANSTFGDDYIFGGDDTDSSAFTMGLGITVTGDGLASSASFLSVSGSIDSAIAVRFTEDGTVGADALDYEYSLDGGETWTEGVLASGASTLDLGDCQVELVSGITVNAASDDEEGTEFLVRDAVYYEGSGEAMSVTVSDGIDVDMTSVGSEIFGGLDSTGTAYSGSNLLEAVASCLAYMEAGDYEGVASCLESLRAGQEQLLAGASSVGARETKVSTMEESLGVISEVTDNSISSLEDADATQILIELEQANYIYEAVLSSTSDIMQMSLLDYL